MPLSAHASIFGAYDYNRTSIAPPGTKVVAHSYVDARTTFSPHGRLGWYIGPSLEHYSCFKIYFTDTLYECDVLKIDFFHPQIPFPTTTNDNYLRKAAEDMPQLLQAQRPVATSDPLSFGTPALNAFGEVAKLLGRDVSKPATLILPDHIATPVPLPTPPHRSYAATPPRVSPTFGYASETNFSPKSVPKPLSHPPTALPRVPYTYSYP